MEFFTEVFVKYWLQWIFGLIAAGIALWAKRYIKLERERINRERKEHDKQICEKVVAKLDTKIKEVDQRSQEGDKQIRVDLEVLTAGLENLTLGLLSVQGKEFRQECLDLLDPGHEITVIEYEQFEEDYAAYKALNGNHRGDALHDRVVEKFNNQLARG